ncbi:MAG: hypothetical protein EZS28_004060 [Streblomastix strix]|uniref:Uncharacterized protein n=1 Tax=Streblomastix strix TaxID=222440 RepID=A0A5J4WZT8_9EUKA|nr:MAG: hypothetical protein EZS28_004060 [Streblomastix strix]
MAEIKHKELTDEDKIRLQLINDAISRIKTMPQIGLERSETIDDTSKTDTEGLSYAKDSGINAKPKENPTQTGNEIIQVTPEQLILTEQKKLLIGKIIKQGGTSNQILLANGDTIEKQKLEPTTAKSGIFHAGDYVVGLSQGWCDQHTRHGGIR